MAGHPPPGRTHSLAAVRKTNLFQELLSCYLAEVGIQVHDAVAEFFHILRQQLVWVGDAVVQIAHFVVGETSGECRMRSQKHKEHMQKQRDNHLDVTSPEHLWTFYRTNTVNKYLSQPVALISNPGDVSHRFTMVKIIIDGQTQHLRKILNSGAHSPEYRR